MAKRKSRSRRLDRAIVLAVLAFSGLHPLRAQQGAGIGALVDRCVEAYGGAERLRAIDGWQQIGRIVSPTRGEGVMVRVFAPPDRLRVETRFADDSGEVRILNRERGWRSGRPVEGAAYASMVMQAARLSLPLILLEGKDRIRDQGEVEREGGSLRLLRLDLRDGMHLEIEIDQKTATIERSRSVAGPLIFETLYQDFREAGGVLFPFVETTWAMGHQTGRFELDRVVLDDQIRDHLFLP